MKTRILVSLVSVVASASALSKDLEFSIRATPQSIKLGDRITFTFIYRNASQHEIGIVPEYYAYQALDVHLTSVDSGKVGRMLPYLSPYVDPNLARRNFRVVKPGQEYTRTSTATLSAALPKSVQLPGRRSGLYLVFADSAIELPGFGKYKATSRYIGVESYKNQLATPDRSRLWLGKTFAQPIVIQFRNR